MTDFFLDDNAHLPIELKPATAFTLAELTETYNQARMDYIVPMPMNVARMQEYIHKYDVQLDHSVVAVAGEYRVGLAMLGVRPRRTWITRLGVIPVARRHRAGQRMMEYLIARARALGAACVVLEVIKNNEPAHRLFRKLGFRETRELLIMRRPPGPPTQDVGSYAARMVGEETALTWLRRRRSQPSWLDDFPSLTKVGGLAGVRVELPDGGWGWLVYHSTTFQLSYLVLQTEAGGHARVSKALLHALHVRHPAHDTKTENVPLDAPYLPSMRAMGYLESFRRIEMRLTL